MKRNTLNIILIILLLLAFFGLIRSLVSGVEETVWRNDNYCEAVFNTSARGHDEFFGKFCAVVDYENMSIVKYYYSNSQMMDYCGRIGFFELNKWKDKCS